MEGTFCQGHLEALAGVVNTEAQDLALLKHRSSHIRGVVRHYAQNLAVVCEPLGVVPLISVARQLERPVRELEAQGIPSFATPAFPDSVAFQNDMLAPSPLQDAAHSEPGLPASNDNNVVLLTHNRLPTTW
jgi:hypothetical protein